MQNTTITTAVTNAMITMITLHNLNDLINLSTTINLNTMIPILNDLNNLNTTTVTMPAMITVMRSMIAMTATIVTLMISFTRTHHQLRTQPAVAAELGDPLPELGGFRIRVRGRVPREGGHVAVLVGQQATGGHGVVVAAQQKGADDRRGPRAQVVAAGGDRLWGRGARACVEASGVIRRVNEWLSA